MGRNYYAENLTITPWNILTGIFVGATSYFTFFAVSFNGIFHIMKVILFRPAALFMLIDGNTRSLHRLVHKRRVQKNTELLL
jgi:hypothetical protein